MVGEMAAGNGMGMATQLGIIIENKDLKEKIKGGEGKNEKIA